MPSRNSILLAAALTAWLPSGPLASPPEPGPARAAAAAPPRWAQAPESAAGQLLWLDPEQGSRTGADNILFLHGALGRLEDRLLPTRIFEEEGLLKRATSISYRTAKVLFLDLAPAAYLPLVQHEVFGHGYRAREAGYSDIRYELHAPPPYGLGDGSTSWVEPASYAATPDRNLAMAGAGIEAADVLTARLRGKWLRDGAMDNHEAWLYLGSALGLATYLAATAADETDESNDVVAWIGEFNRNKAGSGTSEGGRMDLGRLEDGSRLSYADPCLWFSAWTALRYLWNGSSRWSYPMVPLGPARWLPLLGYRITPFGDQWVMENLVAVGNRSFQARFSKGDGRAGPTFGADLEARDALGWRGFSLDAALGVWKQPPLWLDSRLAPPSADEALGIGIRADLVSPALSGSLPLRLAAGFGAKQAGYVPGEALEGGLTFRAGLGLFR